ARASAETVATGSGMKPGFDRRLSRFYLALTPSPSRPSARSVMRAFSGSCRYCCFTGACKDLSSSAFMFRIQLELHLARIGLIRPIGPMFSRGLHLQRTSLCRNSRAFLARLYVLVHSEKVIGIIFILDLN